LASWRLAASPLSIGRRGEPRAAPVLLLALVLCAAGAARGAEGHAAARPPARVRVVTVGSATAPRSVAASLSAVQRATISTRLSAAVRQVAVGEGSRVPAGALLVRLADEDVRSAVAAARTALAAASAQESRMVKLAAARAATQAEVDQARTGRAQAQAALSAALASLAQTEIRAPFAGVVQARRVNPGDFVGPGQPLVELEGDALEVLASLSDEEARGIAVGDEVRFEANGREGTARVTALSPGGDPLSHRRSLRALVRTGREGLRSGDFARLSLPGSPGRPGLWVPRSALVERGDLTGIFVASGGRAELRWLALGERLGDRVHVRAGLAPGEQVIDAPGPLRDGEAVEVGP
jgi:membrane fusion protein (multidrug efflux system)